MTPTPHNLTPAIPRVDPRRAPAGDTFVPPRSGLVLGAGLSVAGHLGLALLVAVPAFWGGGSAGGAWAAEAAEERVVLGMDRARAVTLTWLGYEDPEPEPHLARLSETDQAALTPTPGQAALPSLPPTPEASEPAPSMSSASGGELPEAGSDAPLYEADLVLPESGGERPGRVAPVRPEGDGERESRGEATPESPPTPPTPPGEGAGREGRPGEGSERASDATSTEPTLVVDPGRPASAQGLEILTDHIRWSIIDLRLARPRNPTVAMTFDMSGRPTLVEFVPDEHGVRRSTGHNGVDETLINAMYRWRARGERLEEMRQRGETDVRIVLRVRLVAE